MYYLQLLGRVDSLFVRRHPAFLCSRGIKILHLDISFFALGFLKMLPEERTENQNQNGPNGYANTKTNGYALVNMGVPPRVAGLGCVTNIKFTCCREDMHVANSKRIRCVSHVLVGQVCRSWILWLANGNNEPRPGHAN